MHGVLEHIDRHLDRPLELAELAEVAHFSAFHFHRVFAAWLGETLGEYLRRRRLEVAATRLMAQPRVPILAIALSVGFGSSEAFSRAFKNRFGRPPTTWRTAQAAQRRSRGTRLPHDEAGANSNPDQLVSNTDQAAGIRSVDNGASEQSTAERTMNVSVVDRAPATVAYLRHIGPYGEPLSQFWQNVVYPWMVSNNLLGQPRYGVSHDDPSITAAEKCRYDAAVVISKPLSAPGKALTTTIPGGRYGMVAFRGRAGQIGDVWGQLLRDWLPSSGLQLDARPFLEYYGENSTYDPATGVFTCELGIPVTAV